MSAKYSNKEEHHYFLLGALAWRGSVTPRILLNVLITGLYTFGVIWIDKNYYDLPHFAVTPFEYTGAVLGLVLVFRTNAGHDRWWEARKLWGAITNQIRNLFIMTWNYGETNSQWRNEMTKWLVTFAFAHKESLRFQKNFDELKALLSTDEITALQNASHMPLFVSDKIAALLEQARFTQQIDLFTFAEFEKQRAALIDSIGGNERIVKTPMPLVYAIKARRFILIYLLLLPFSLINEAGMMSPLIAILVAYPLLSLDRIGIELQNPFAKKNLSHLPLDTICDGIKANALALKK
ncbi:MAG: bestrophin family ion channel [Methylococcaceae bacterium]